MRLKLISFNRGKTRAYYNMSYKKEVVTVIQNLHTDKIQVIHESHEIRSKVHTELRRGKI